MITNTITEKLCEWLDATTSYDTDLKENLTNYPNHDKQPKWRRFYQFGPVLVSDETSVMDADGTPTNLKLAIKAVAYDQSVQPGDIIQSGNGQRYLVQPNGSLRKCTVTKS